VSVDALREYNRLRANCINRDLPPYELPDETAEPVQAPWRPTVPAGMPVGTKRPPVSKKPPTKKPPTKKPPKPTAVPPTVPDDQPGTSGTSINAIIDEFFF